tara:strand:- start:35 stop:643 length:609 start_codon:yes stop_codon:yes gene_type:complete
MSIQPSRLENKDFSFVDFPTFRPNISPEEILRGGSFGGTYFRNITSKVTNQDYTDTWKELPPEWITDLEINKYVSSDKYRKNVNKYRVKCGSSLDEWESSGWINEMDPYGWFQWYCRFFQGRRCEDDVRQIKRFNRCASSTGRWRLTLCKKISDKIVNGTDFTEALNDFNISPGIRQTLQHWAYSLTHEDLESYMVVRNLIK